MDDLQKKLKALLQESTVGGRNDLEDALSDLTDLITDAFNSDLERLKIDRRVVIDTIAAAHTAAALIDSCNILGSRVIARAAFRSFSLPRSRRLESLEDFFRHEIRPMIGERPFVYVAWRRSPEEFLYVGRSDNKDGKGARLGLNNRGKLLDALQDATIFTVVLLGAGVSINDVEAATLRVLDDHDRFPTFNDRQERVPNAVGTAHLERLGRFLVGVGNRLEASRNALTQIMPSPKT